MPEKSGGHVPDAVRVGVYRRVRTDQARLDLFVTSQPHWKIVQKFTDNDSGRRADRPGLRNAMRSAGAGRIDVLLVDHTSDLSPVFPVLVRLLCELDQAGVAVRSVSEPFDTATPMGRMMLTFMESLVQWEREAKARQKNDEATLRGGDRG
ncbi:recombinase family protein [Actinosynnema sp. CS-041913]|uniref:recombinase family protein n=1 Tax=Actinosynnema sp. CS-041913 TaxID=3239917 RepID=UPI003D9025C9